MLIIGELINTSRKPVREAVEKRDAPYIRDIVKAQEKAGAACIDVNCGTFAEAEAPTMDWLVETVLEATALPLCVDSPNPSALEAALKKAAHGQWMINSITDEAPRWAAVLPLVKKYGTKIIALCIEDAGMPKSAKERVRIAGSLITRLTAAGVALDDIYIDPLVTPISTGERHGVEVLDAVQQIMNAYPGVHTVCGLTNISFGLPARHLLNRTFMVQTMARGMDSYILDPTDEEMRGVMMASQALVGNDRFCRRFITAFRQGLYGKQG
ncbi:MAG: methyltetrahydrofolate cobalamin methyltransferase [Syntrophorhabdales bacterium]|jgi:5-methyltetrahydrofolate--homocysteine methyltransferase